MKGLACVIALLTACASAQTLRETIPSELQAAASAAEGDGAALFEAAKAGHAPAQDQEREARSKVTDFCDFKYKAVLANVQTGFAIFFLAQPRIEGEVVFGRHFKVAGGNVYPSTKSCIAFPPAPANAVASMVTHLLSPAPNEFHVYVSLDSGKPVYVATSAGNWLVDKGKISFLQKR